MVQLDLFGFPIEEKPAKKQEKPAAAPRPQVKEAPAPEPQPMFTAEPPANEPVPEPEHVAPVAEQALREGAAMELQLIEKPAVAAGAAGIVEEAAIPGPVAEPAVEETTVNQAELTTHVEEAVITETPVTEEELMPVIIAETPVMEEVQLTATIDEAAVEPELVTEAPAPVLEQQAGASIAEEAPIIQHIEEPVDEPAGDGDDIIEVNQTLFSRTALKETVAPAKRAPTKGKRGRKSFKDIDAELALVEVPDDEELFKKLYYSISQVAKWFNVNVSLLRFWENEFDILKPRKSRKGDRMFRPEDVKNLQVIYHLLRQRKFSIEGAKKYLKQNKSKAEVNIQLIQSLTKFRSFLLEMKANLGA